MAVFQIIPFRLMSEPALAQGSSILTGADLGFGTVWLPDLSDRQLLASLPDSDLFREGMRPDLLLSLIIGGQQKPAARPAYFFLERALPRRRSDFVSNEDLAQFLREAKGDRAKAGIRAGLAESTITRRVDAAQKGNPLYEHKRTRQRCRVDDWTLAAALARHHGNRRKAAKEVGLSSATVSERISKAKEKSLLSPYKTEKGRRLPKLSNALLSLEMRRCGNNATVVAEAYGVSPHGLNTRIRNAADEDPDLGSLKKRRVEKRKPSGKRTNASVKRAKTSAPTPRPVLFALQMQAAPDASPVAKMVRDRISDARMAEVLAKHSPNIDGAAEELGVIPEVVRRRLGILKKRPEWGARSLLAPFLFLAP